jgi:hypothetical protein
MKHLYAAALLLMIALPQSSTGAEENTARSNLSTAIHLVMERYRDVAGITDVTEILCAELSEEDLAKAMQDVEGVNSRLTVIDASDPNVPPGALFGYFSRGLQIFKSQSLRIYIKDDPRYCEAYVQTVAAWGIWM